MKQGKKSGALRAIAGLGAIEVARGQRRRAVCLFAASQQQSINIGADYLFDAKNRHSKWLNEPVESAHAGLSESHLAEAIAQGQMMSFEQLVEYALQKDL